MRTHRPHLPELVTISRADAVCRRLRQAAAVVEGPKSVDQVQIIVQVATVKTVLRVDLIVDPDDVLSPVLRVIRLKGRITGGGGVREGAGLLRHQPVDGGNGLAVSR